MLRVLTIPGGAGDQSFPLTGWSIGEYWVRSVCFGYQRADVSNREAPVLRVERAGVGTIMLCAGLAFNSTAEVEQSPSFITFSEAPAFHGTTGDQGQLTFSLNIPLPAGGLYVPESSVCRLDFDQGSQNQQVGDIIFVIEQADD